MTTTGNKDIDTLASEPTPAKLLTGQEVQIERLRTKQLFKLMKVVTSGASEVLGSLRFESDMDPAEFTGQLLGALVLAIPDAEEETMEFIRSMVTPVLIEGDRLSANEQEINRDRIATFDAEMANPELDDLITVIENVAINEGPHLLALGKRLALLLKVQQKSTTAKRSASSKTSTKA